LGKSSGERNRLRGLLVSFYQIILGLNVEKGFYMLSANVAVMDVAASAFCTARELTASTELIT